MKLLTFLSVLCLSICVSGKGLRVAYEKLWLFYAYEIDQLNPEDQRTIGFKCTEVESVDDGGCKDVDPKYTACTVVDKKWDPVSGTMGQTKRACKSLKEFMSFIDDKKWTASIIPGGPSQQATTTPPVDETAKSIHDKGMDLNRYPPWRVIKDGTKFNFMIDTVSTVIANTKASLTTDQYEANKALFDGNKASMDKVKWYRYVDHSYYLMDYLKEKIPGINLVADDAGFKQTVRDNDGNLIEVDSKSFNRQATIDGNIGSIPDVEAQLSQAYYDYYEGPDASDAAKDHKIVMDSFELGGNTIDGVSCSI